jgi:hypothetical protein
MFSMRDGTETAGNREPTAANIRCPYFVSNSPISLAIRFTDAVYRPNLADISRVLAFSRTSLTSRRFSASVQIFGFELAGRVFFIAARQLHGLWRIETSCRRRLQLPCVVKNQIAPTVARGYALERLHEKLP